MRRFGVWIAILLLVTWLQFIGGGWFGIYESALRLASLVLIALVLGSWLIAAVRDPGLRPDSAMWVPILAGVGSMALSTIASRQPRISLEYLAWAVLLVALYLLLVRLLRIPFLAGRLTNLAAILLVVTAAAYLIAVGSRWLQWWDLVGHLAFPPLRPAFESFLYGNPSSVMAAVVLLACSAVAATGFGSTRRAAVAGIVVVLAGAVTVASGSRAGWLAAAAAGLVLALAVVASREARSSIASGVRTLTARRGARGAVIAIGVAGLAVAAVLAPGILRRALDGGQSIRGAFTTAALRMFAEAPLVGTGPGTWVAQRIAYTVSPEPDYYIPHAHNMYAQVLAELGMVGAVAGAVLLIWLVRLVLGALRGGDPARRRWGYAALVASVYFGVHSTLDVFTNMPAILFPLALPIAWLDASRPSPDPRASGGAGRLRPFAAFAPQLRAILAVAAAASVAGALVVLVALEGSALRNQQAVDLANEGRWAEAAPLAGDAVAGDPEMPAFRYTLGLALDRAGDHAGAADAFRMVAEGDDLPEAWLNLAAEEAALGHREAALEAVRQALRLGYQRTAVSMPAGQLAVELGERALAIDAFTAAVIVTPSLAGDPFWAADPARAAIFAEIVRAATIAEDPSRAWEIPLMIGDGDSARLLAVHSFDPDLARDVIAAWTGDAAAETEVRNRCDAAPLDLAGLGWCARLAERAGDSAAAARYRFESEYLQGGAGEAASELRVATAPGVGRWIAGGQAEFWGHYTYRRPIPWDLLVPSLVHLVTG